jgi:hypothetical protein
VREWFIRSAHDIDAEAGESSLSEKNRSQPVQHQSHHSHSSQQSQQGTRPNHPSSGFDHGTTSELHHGSSDDIQNPRKHANDVVVLVGSLRSGSDVGRSLTLEDSAGADGTAASDASHMASGKAGISETDGTKQVNNFVAMSVGVDSISNSSHFTERCTSRDMGSNHSLKLDNAAAQAPRMSSVIEVYQFGPDSNTAHIDGNTSRSNTDNHNSYRNNNAARGSFTNNYNSPAAGVSSAVTFLESNDPKSINYVVPIPERPPGFYGSPRAKTIGILRQLSGMMIYRIQLSTHC